MHRTYTLTVGFCVLALAALLLPATGKAWVLNDPDNFYQVTPVYEVGFIGVVSHRIQFGETGTVFDYVKEGGQRNLYLFKRYSADISVKSRHNFVFLYQPLDVQTQALLYQDLVVDNMLFPAGTPMNLRYGFDFFRVSYLYDFIKSPKRELALGLSFQIRNATISFASQDGKLFRTNQNIGPVPILKFRWREPLPHNAWFSTEADGFYASGRYITGSANDFMGAIFDVSLRYGFRMTKALDGFFNVRYLGGGARGSQKDKSPNFPGDGFADNWLNTLSFTLGLSLK